MNFNELQLTIDKMSYKGTSRIQAIIDRNTDYVIISVHMPVYDVMTGNLSPQICSKRITCEELRQIHPDIVNQIVYGLWRKLELHEVDEWFKVDGKNYIDPHPEITQKESA